MISRASPKPRHDVDRESTVRRTLSNHRVFTSEVARRNLIDLGIIPYAAQCAPQTFDVLRIAIDEQIDVLSCADQSVQTKRNTTDENIVDALKVERAKHLE